jgi:DNA mismatch repair ATPase MutS
MFKSWICHPLRDIKAIEERLDAVDDICSETNIQGMYFCYPVNRESMIFFI